MRRFTAAFMVALAVALMAGLAQGGADLLRARGADSRLSADRGSASDASRPVTRTAGADPVGTLGLKTVTYNLCGGQCNTGGTGNLPEVVKKIDEFQPHLVMLQEVCYSQYEWFTDTYKEKGDAYHFAFTPMLTNYRGCGATDCAVNEDSDQTNDDNRCTFGQVVGARGTLRNPDVIDLGGERHQIKQGKPGDPIEQVSPKRKFAALCYDAALTDLPSRVVKGCSVHLRAFHDEKLVNQRARTAQAARLASELDGDIAAGKIVVVAGDFNSWPDQGNSWVEHRTPAMDAFYRPDARPNGGWGVFYEADQADKDAWKYVEPACTAANCRAGERTVSSRDFVYGQEPVGKGTKYDYIFYSETTAPSSISADAFYLFVKNADGTIATKPDGTAKRISDHTFYRGQAQVKTS
ncbi:endonuclease/exonuclease/phosphatase family protein [Streptomyces sp. NPDC051310]|uniref:endonuclease/exonuclease/phosphatase family protein n=1 Tax=Streptomyces sp. NPDC051310 TaxID=3365649 RepID=UPI0037914ECF